MIFIYFIPSILVGQINNQLKWEELPSLPNKKGLAGMFAGVSNGSLIAIGGANFPGQMPWNGGQKVWHDDIFILGEGASSWEKADKKLPRPLAYGVSVSYRDKVIMVGGSNANGHYSDVYALTYDQGKIEIDTLVSLPHPLANMSGALVGDVLFLAGGSTSPSGMPINSFLAFDFLNHTWVKLDSWPGPPRIQGVSASLEGNFFLFSGIDKQKNSEGKTERIVLRDGYKFIPIYKKDHIRGGKWVSLSKMPRGVAASPSPAPAVGVNHILFPGGLDRSTATHADPTTFPGFVRGMLAYNVENDTWLNFGNLPAKSTRVTLPTAKWNKKWVMPSGEVGPGKRSPKVFAISKKDTSFGWLNWASISLYMVLLLWIGFNLSKKDGTTEAFFKADGRIPWWAAGISIYGTQMSAITFMAIPAIAFAKDWYLVAGVVTILAIIPILVKFYLPFFRRLNITSAYEYLEHRFSINVRLFGSISFILLQLGRMGIVLYLPALAVASVTGINIYLLLGIMGIISTFYTVQGGIEAVIWTDVLQVVVLLGGAMLCLFIAISDIGGVGRTIVKGLEYNKFTIFHFGWDPNKPVLWVVLVGFFFLNIITYSSDQTVVQRYLTVKDEQAAARSLWMNGLITLPGILLFYGLGTVLFVFFRDNPAIIQPETVTEILPFFIVHKIPAGLSGIIIAGIFAASMSSLDSSMNSISTAYVTDIHKHFYNKGSDRTYLTIAKVVTILVGIVGTVSAMLTAAFHVQFLYDYWQEIIGVFGSSLGGLFILGIFTNRTNAPGAMWGIVAGVSAVWLIRYNIDISPYLYGAIGVVTSVTVGYFTSFFFAQKKNLDGLTYNTLHRQFRKSNNENIKKPKAS